MVVCLCRNVTSREIEEHIDRGARTLEEVGRRCGAGTDCGGCHADLEELLARAESGRSGTHHKLPVIEEDARVA